MTALGTPPDSWEAHDWRQAAKADAGDDQADAELELGEEELRLMSELEVVRSELAARRARDARPAGPSIVSALAAAQAEFPPIPKNHEADAGSYVYKYADIADVLAAVRPVLGRHGIALVQSTRATDSPGRLILDTVLMHDGGTISSEFPITVGGLDPQKVGAVMTYARRYQLCSILGIAAEDDLDAKGVPAPPAERTSTSSSSNRSASRSSSRSSSSPSSSSRRDTAATHEEAAPAEQTGTPAARVLKARIANVLGPTWDSDGRRAFVTEVVARNVENLAELTEPELATLIAHLEALEGGDAAAVLTAEGVEIRWRDTSTSTSPPEPEEAAAP